MCSRSRKFTTCNESLCKYELVVNEYCCSFFGGCLSICLTLCHVYLCGQDEEDRIECMWPSNQQVKQSQRSNLYGCKIIPIVGWMFQLPPPTELHTARRIINLNSMHAYLLCILLLTHRVGCNYIQCDVRARPKSATWSVSLMLVSRFFEI